MDAHQKLSNGSTLIKEALVQLTDECTGKLNELASLTEKINKAREDLQRVTNALDQERTTFKNALNKHKKDLTTAQDELAVVNTEMQTAQNTLTSIKKKHGEFVAYQLRAEKALKAREQSILEREKALDEAIGQAKRRVSILGGIS